MLENFGVFRYPDRMENQIDLMYGLRRRERGVVIEDKGSVFNSDLTQSDRARLLPARPGLVHAAGGAPGRSRAAPARARPTSPSATTRGSSSTPSRWVDGEPRLDYAPMRMTKWEPMVRSY